MQEDRLYTRSFYARQRWPAARSAAEIVPLLLEHLAIRSVCDVGCGAGAWLAAFAERGVEDVSGFDGDYVARADLMIPPERFVAHDLKQPIRCDRSFDLVVCLEVAEHLPERCADDLVSSLVGLSPLVLFSAAIPHQGGMGHVNERWPSYWARRFSARDYTPVDYLRPRIWSNPRVNSWYKQNTLLYVRRDRLAQLPADRFAPAALDALDLVHPDHYLKYVTGELANYRLLLRRLPERIGRRFRRRRDAATTPP